MVATANIQFNRPPVALVLYLVLNLIEQPDFVIKRRKVSTKVVPDQSFVTTLHHINFLTEATISAQWKLSNRHGWKVSRENFPFIRPSSQVHPCSQV